MLAHYGVYQLASDIEEAVRDGHLSVKGALDGQKIRHYIRKKLTTAQTRAQGISANSAIVVHAKAQAGKDFLANRFQKWLDFVKIHRKVCEYIGVGNLPTDQEIFANGGYLETDLDGMPSRTAST